MVGRNIQREFEVIYPAFSAALAETIAWCTRPGRPTTPREALWSGTLRQTAARDAVDAGGWWSDVWWPDPQECDIGPMVARVRRVATARRQRLAGEGLRLPPADGGLHGGRLLACDPTLSLRSASAAAESRGFFDDTDSAGWDAWVMAFDTRPGRYQAAAGQFLLLSWIPPDLLPVAAAGVLVNEIDNAWWPPRSADARACLRSILAGTAG